MNSRRKKISIISISLLFHAIVLVALLIFYKSPEHQWLFLDTKDVSTHETIFSELSQAISEPSQPIPPIIQQEPWAELKPRASTFGDSMDMPDENLGIESHESSSDTLSNDPSRRVEDAPQDEYENIGTEFEKSSKDTSKQIIHESDGFPFILRSAKGTSRRAAKKLQAQKALASIARGYLEQLKHEGENLIKTIGGDPNKMPSAEQLKYERYLAKIQWCLQNAHNINRDKCQVHEPIEVIMRVYFTLDRNGKMADLKIVQSSGDLFVDRYIHSLFEQASSSFPPLPSYIKEDPYQLLYTVMVCWNVASPTHMGFMRE